MSFAQFNEVNESSLKRFSECSLSKLGEKKNFDKPMSDYDKPLAVVWDTSIDNLEKEKVLDEYFDDLNSKSDCPETIKQRPFETLDLIKLSPEEVALKREEFDDIKPELKKQWEEENGRPWPKYEQDVYSLNGNLIRKAGAAYDAHHIQPLGMGGKNEVANITPLKAEVHYDKQGIHAQNSPYSKLDKILGGID